MIHHEAIRVYLRLRPQASIYHSSILGTSSPENAPYKYVLEPSFSGRTKLTFHVDRRGETEIINNSLEDFTFQFRHVFESHSTQEDVFNLIAKDCVLSVLDGYNSTIFAYGQTGSGKTYSITGGTESYDERGIIPRALGLVYDEVSRRQQDCFWTVSVSYLQIYNDKGQDLLNHGRDARTLEELPNVTIHEASSGSEEQLGVVLRGLEQHVAPTLTDALNLLFLGDTNRLYCETPMNRTSSRSHCVFIISLEARGVGSSVVRRSKLNLVDLAGSERVSKSGVGGTILSEAKYINLSLHYLEQVIVALSEQAKGKRDHVPFRNSFLTMVLRDSLGGNCRTSMLATAHLSKTALPETISTCSFAQRVALIKQDARINEETDPVLLVKKLKTDVAQLRDQLAFYEKNTDGKSRGADRTLSEEEIALCRGMVDAYIGGGDRIEGFEGDMARIYYCFDLMKRKILAGSSAVGESVHRSLSSLQGCNTTSSTSFHKGNTPVGQRTDSADGLSPLVKIYEEQIERLQNSLKQKENEINTILNILHHTETNLHNAATQTLEDVENHCDASAQVNHFKRAPLGGTEKLQQITKSNHVDSSQVSLSYGSNINSTTLERLVDLTEQGKIDPIEAAAAEEYLRRKQEHTHDLSALSDTQLVEDRALAFEAFKDSCQDYEKIEATKRDLKAAYTICKQTAQKLNESVDSMKKLKQRIQRLRAERAVDGIEIVDPHEQILMDQLSSTREQYNNLVVDLRDQKKNIDSMHAFMKHSQQKVARNFEEWLKTRKKQVTIAVENGCLASLPKEAPIHVKDKTPNRTFHHFSASSEPRHPSSAPTPGLNGPTKTNILSNNTISTSVQHPCKVFSSSPLFTHSSSHSVPNSVVSSATYSSPGVPFSTLPVSPSVSTTITSSMPIVTISPMGSTVAPSQRLHYLDSLTPPPSSEVLRCSDRPCSHAENSALNPTVLASMDSLSPKPFHLQPLELQTSLSTQPSSGCAPMSNKEKASPASSRFDVRVVGNATFNSSGSNMGTQNSSSRYPTQANPYAPAHRSTGNKAADEQLATLYKLRDAMRQQMEDT